MAALTIGDIEAAAERLRGLAVCTPLLASDALDEVLGCRLLVKAEPLQRSGSFKFRGAYNAIAQSEAPAVVAFSSGNHAQGVALAARLLGKRATIVMPADAPAAKLQGTRALGAEIVTYDRWAEAREAIGRRIAAETGAELIRPFDDLRVMAGQGTIGLEIAAQTAELGLRPDIVVAGASGGGLMAGIATALSGRIAGIDLYTAEPEAFDDHARSFAAGERLANAPGGSSICDALLSPMPGELTFPINRGLVRGGVVAGEGEIRAAMRAAFRHLKLVVEPGGATALAAVLAGRLEVRGRVAVVVASGGNVDPGLYADILTES